jgi:hypothetical protein
MRSRATNILQIIVLFTGIIYITIGLFYYISPITMLNMFTADSSVDWIKQILGDEILSPLYFISRSFAAILFSSGIAMILPLFDPLKYRGLIYCNGLIFPFFSSIMLLYNSFSSIFLPGMSYKHNISFILGIVFLFIFISTILGLILTKRLADDGLE